MSENGDEPRETARGEGSPPEPPADQREPATPETPEPPEAATDPVDLPTPAEQVTPTPTPTEATETPLDPDDENTPDDRDARDADTPVEADDTTPPEADASAEADETARLDTDAPLDDTARLEADVPDDATRLDTGALVETDETTRLDADADEVGETSAETTRVEALPVLEPAATTRVEALPDLAAIGAASGSAGAGKAGEGASGKPEPSTASRQPGLKRRRGRLIRRLAYGVLGVLGIGVILFAIAYVLTPIPESQQLSAREQLNIFYYADGKTVIVEEGTNRRPVDLAAVSPSVKEAVISAENRSFYTDPGISVSGTFRAFWSTVSGQQVQGGSTITQQMVRNYYSGLSQERSLFRKLKEVMVSLKVSQSKDKDWIMEQYLNTIYFGRQSYGIQAAAQTYFKVDAKDLDPAQGAYLAATIQQPSTFSKVTKENRASLESRWRYVVNGMVDAGNLTQAEASALKFPTPVKEEHKNIYRGQIGYMVNVAKKELREQRGIDDEDLALGGLRVVTTFRKPLMDAAVKAVKDNVPADMPKEQRVGLTAVDPGTGEVMAFYGGRDFLKEQLSSSFGLRAQAGSGFKPFALAAALESGVKLTDTYSGAAPLVVNGHPIRNSSGRGYGNLNLVQMTRDSTNTSYVRLGQDIGNDRIVKLAESLGIPRSQLTANGANTAATFPLGVTDVSPAQQAGAYAAFANAGIWYKPHVIKSITNRRGVERKIKVEGVRVMSKDTAADATYAMEQVVRSGTATAARLYDRDAAGKTGTTDGGAAVWFNGYIPQISTSVGIFQTKNMSKSLNLSPYSAYGGVLPAMVWRQFMAEATQGMEVKEFPDPVTYDYTPYYDYAPEPDGPSSPSGPSPSGPEGPDEPTVEPPVEPEPGGPGQPGDGPDLPDDGGVPPDDGGVPPPDQGGAPPDGGQGGP
ncbi:penicillin-binding protein [Actinocorallia sp. API 0066]|uniref:transglycosylase domain-containing protein n=1 Tax=Actinocorallia sp. API 0066 TaxID=2896846 RepID=UPI001E527CF5|nr:transglycosylase domain-containing protein [Actinocorallia sp. API 0066]MCD0452757.1 penicillin-binding protein [Actinocorallia sp. API 0066]